MLFAEESRAVTDVDEGREARRRELVLLVGPIAVLAAAALTGVALTPTLAPEHPLALMILDARSRTLVLVAQRVDFVPFLAVAIVRRLASDPLSYLLGRRHGERAIRWIERRGGGSGNAIRTTEAVFRRASWLMVFLFPGLLVCALAGQSGMHPLVFAALNIGGTVALVVTLRVFGTTVLADPVDQLLTFFNDHRLATTAASVGLVLLWLVVQKVTGRIDAPSLDELEAELAGAGDSEVEEGVEADGQARTGADRLDREHDPGHERDAVEGVVADRQALAGGAEEHFLVGDHAPHAHRVDADARRAASPPRAPLRTSLVVGSAAHSVEAAAMRSAVSIAVPEGASIFWSWCSSMISPVSNHGAASSANRMSRTAPMAKLGAMKQLLVVKRSRRSREIVVGETRRADDGVDTAGGAPLQVLTGGVDLGEVDRDVGRGPVERADIRGDGHAGGVLADVLGVDGSDQIKLGVGCDGGGHRLPHAPTGAQDRDADRQRRPPRPPRVRLRRGPSPPPPLRCSASAGPRSPNSCWAWASNVSSNDTNSRSPPPAATAATAAAAAIAPV